MALLGPDNHMFLEYERAVCMANDVNVGCAYELGMEYANKLDVKDNEQLIFRDDPKIAGQAERYYSAILSMMQSSGKNGYLKIDGTDVIFVETSDKVQYSTPSPIRKMSLRDIRTYKGYTEDEAAKHCGVSTEKMKQIEADPGKMKARMAIKLRKLYGIPLDYISI